MYFWSCSCGAQGESENKGVAEREAKKHICNRTIKFSNSPLKGKED